MSNRKSRNQNVKKEEFKQKEGKKTFNVDNIKLAINENKNINILNQNKEKDLLTEENEKVLLTEVETIKKKENNRKNFLKEKLNNLEVDENLKKGASSGIVKAKESFEKEFKDKNSDIELKNSPMNLKEILNKKINLTNQSRNNLTKEEEKQLKLLKISEENTKNSIVKLEKNKKLIEEEGLNLINNSIVDKNIRIAKINSIKDKTNLLQKKLENINNQIEEITAVNKPSKKEILSKYLENFEKDKEDYKLKIQEYAKQSKEIKEKIKKDKLITSQKREKLLEKIEKENIENKEKLFQEKKEKEHQIFLKRKNETEEKIKRVKPFIKEINKKSKNEYLYYRNKERFDLNEQMMVDRVNLQKKNFVTLDEIKELSERRKEQKEILDKEIKEKNKKLHQMWNNRSQILPTFKSKLAKICEEEDKEKYNYEEKKRKIAELEKEKLEYSKNNIPKPLVNQKLKSFREISMKKIDRNSVILTEKNNKKRNEMFYVSPPKRIHTLSVSNIDSYNKINEDEELYSILKKKKRFLKPIQILHPKPEKPINYLDEIIKQRDLEGKKKSPRIIKLNIKNSGNQTGDIMEQLDFFKVQAEHLDEEVKQKRLYMKLNGGYQFNPQIGDQVGDMLIESIQAKIDAIHQLN